MNCSKPVVGSVITLQFRFYISDVQDGQVVRIPTSPTTVTLAVEHPDATVTTPSVNEIVAGVWEALVAVDEAGVWRWTVQSTGLVTVSDNGSFAVVPQAVPIP